MFCLVLIERFQKLFFPISMLDVLKTKGEGTFSGVSYINGFETSRPEDVFGDNRSAPPLGVKEHECKDLPPQGKRFLVVNPRSGVRTET